LQSLFSINRIEFTCFFRSYISFFTAKNNSILANFRPGKEVELHNYAQEFQQLKAAELLLATVWEQKRTGSSIELKQLLRFYRIHSFSTGTEI